MRFPGPKFLKCAPPEGSSPKWLLSIALLALAPSLQSCRDALAGTDAGAAAAGVAEQHLPLRQQLVDDLYGRGDSGARLFWWPAGAEPEHVRLALDRAAELFANLPDVDLSSFSVSYLSNNLPQISLWVRRPGNQQLLVYNHGHSGLPEPTEEFARRFLSLVVQSGYDLLLTSMPLTGLNAPVPGVSYRVRTRDLPEVAPVDPQVISRFQHGLYEVIDEPGNYLRYFIDGAVVPLTFIGQGIWQGGQVAVAQPGNSMPPPPGYAAVSYVGLSGGATTGLTTCAILTLRRCVLVAGVMPDDLRVKYARNFGDAEQQSRAVHQGFSTEQRLRTAAGSSGRLVLLFNRDDSCCFADPAATEFQSRYPEFDIRIRPLDFHGYEPEVVLGIMQ